MLHSSPFGCFSLCCSTHHYTRYAYGSDVIAHYAVRSFFSLLTLLQIYLCISKHGRSLSVQLYGIMCETPIFSKQLITLDKRLTYHNRESSAHVIYCLLFDNNSNIKSSTDFWHKFIVLQAVNRAQNYKTQLMSSYRSPKIYHHIRSNAQSPSTNEILFLKNFN